MKVHLDTTIQIDRIFGSDNSSLFLTIKICKPEKKAVSMSIHV